MVFQCLFVHLLPAPKKHGKDELKYICVFVSLSDSVTSKCIKCQDGEGVGRKGKLALELPR